MRLVIVAAIVAGIAMAARSSRAEGTVSTYLQGGWDIKAVSQISETGRTQIILQKGTQGMVCTVYYSVTDNGWVGQGCSPLP